MNHLIFIIFFLPSFFSQIYVKPDVSCSIACNGSLSYPYPDIKTALNLSDTAPNTLVLMDGIYFVQNLSIAYRSLNIISQNGPSMSIIDGNSNFSCLVLNNGNYHLENITIRNCIKKNDSNLDATVNNSGAGIWIQSASVNLFNVIISSNRADFYGGGIAAVSGSLNFSNCTFNNNSASFGVQKSIFLCPIILKSSTIMQPLMEVEYF